MRLQRTLNSSAFILFLLLWPAFVQADFQAGSDAYDRGDYATAFKEWRPLAELGEADAQHKLGFLYDHGQDVPQDYGQAAHWYRLAAAQGNAAAQHNLGVLYVLGQGVHQDYVQAHMWANLAEAQNHEGGTELKDTLAEKMTSAQIAEAQRLAREWLAQHP